MKNITCLIFNVWLLDDLLPFSVKTKRLFNLACICFHYVRHNNNNGLLMCTIGSKSKILFSLFFLSLIPDNYLRGRGGALSKKFNDWRNPQSQLLQRQPNGWVRFYMIDSSSSGSKHACSSSSRWSLDARGPVESLSSFVETGLPRRR